MPRKITRPDPDANGGPRRLLEEHIKLRAASEVMKAQADKLKAQALDLLEREGILLSDDDSGSQYLAWTDRPAFELGKRRIVGMKREVRRPQERLNAERTEKLLKELGLWEDCTYQPPREIDEDAVLAAAFEQRITDAQLKSLYDKPGEDDYTVAFVLVDEGKV